MNGILVAAACLLSCASVAAERRPQQYDGEWRFTFMSAQEAVCREVLPKSPFYVSVANGSIDGSVAGRRRIFLAYGHIDASGDIDFSLAAGGGAAVIRITGRASGVSAEGSWLSPIGCRGRFNAVLMGARRQTA